MSLLHGCVLLTSRFSCAVHGFWMLLAQMVPSSCFRCWDSPLKNVFLNRFPNQNNWFPFQLSLHQIGVHNFENPPPKKKFQLSKAPPRGIFHQGRGFEPEGDSQIKEIQSGMVLPGVIPTHFQPIEPAR